MRFLVTGGAGFIGSAFVRAVLRDFPTAEVVIFDALTYAGNLSTIADVLDSGRVKFVPGRIQDVASVEGTFRSFPPTHVVNFAAESHNDRSLLDAGSFIQTDVAGVYVLLEACRKFGVERFLQVSTDEVFGSILEGEFTESSPIEPNTPYAASKAGGELQVRAHVKAFKTPALVTHGGNSYGPFHFPEKLIPFFIVRLIDGKKVPLYGEGDQIREWIHVDDHAEGILHALMHGTPGESYNVGDVNERRNRDVVSILLEETGRDESFVKKIPDPRKGAHDARYSMNCDKLRALGWSPKREFIASLRETVRWYRENEAWWRPLIATADYQSFIKRFYGPSLGDDL
ncbi:MAG: dTDP-glucose 4,6-dehydratase [Armatimonadetes bacterium]|nr:dTDP-glucose 4,6-dehydratase [Armatimonadota bacterium]